MTDTDYTHLAILVDRSGSMNSIAVEAEAALRTMLDEQFAEDGRLTVTLAEFDDRYDEVTDFASSLDAFAAWTLAPRGMTALLDAVGNLVTATGDKLAGFDEADRPGKVVVVIVTDGLENQSREWTHEAVKALIDQQTDVYGWEFVYLGANQDAFAVGQSIGVNTTMDYTADAAGTRSVYASASAGVSRFRRGNTQSVVLGE